jgi:uncharacterized membrane protein
MNKPLTGRERDELRRKVVVLDKTVCFHCKKTNLTEEDIYCPNCGFPQQKSEEEQKKFIVDYRKTKSAIKEEKDTINSAKRYLYIAAVVNMIPFISDEILVLIIGLSISLVFVVLAIWINKKPFAAILTGIIFYITLYLFFGLLDATLFISGIIWKIVIVGTLFSALNSVKKLEQLKQ